MQIRRSREADTVAVGRNLESQSVRAKGWLAVALRSQRGAVSSRANLPDQASHHEPKQRKQPILSA